MDQTEYLKLVVRYLSQARELEKLGGADKQVKIETCESPQTADLLRVLGYRMRGGCGSDVVLETVNATRAFLTIDSGFPLAELEQIVRRLEAGQVKLDDAILCYERGTQLKRHCEQKLNEAQQRVDRIVVGPDGAVSAVPAKLD